MSQATSTTRTDPHRPILGAAVVLFVALLGIAGLKSYRDLEVAEARRALLESRIEKTRDGIAALERRISRLKSDPVILERLAREDLGMVYPGDVIIELPRPGAAPASLPSPAPKPPSPGSATAQ